MGFKSDDLAALFAGAAREHVGFGQGTLLDFDPGTFANRVQYRGTILTNIDIISSLDSLSLQTGSSVLLMRWSPTSTGLSSYMIIGQPVAPGSGVGQSIIDAIADALTEQVISEVVRDIFNSAWTSNQIDGEYSRTGTGWGDLDGMGTGPAASALITDAGRAVVEISAELSHSFDSASGVPVYARMGFDVAGATTMEPVETRSVTSRFLELSSTSGDVSISGSTTVSKSFIVDNLNPGTHVFSGKFLSATGDTVTIIDPSIMVTAF